MKSPYLRSDTKGRVRTPRERREQLLDEFEQTGASAAMFARIAGLRYSTFAGWVNRRRKQRAKGGEENRKERALVHFVEAAVESTRSAAVGALCIKLPGGAHALVSSKQDMELAAGLLQALATNARQEVGC